MKKINHAQLAAEPAQYLLRPAPAQTYSSEIPCKSLLPSFIQPCWCALRTLPGLRSELLVRNAHPTWLLRHLLKVQTTQTREQHSSLSTERNWWTIY
jgi:hypothetical protein